MKLSSIGLKKSLVDPCMFHLKDEKGNLRGQVITHVDDFIITGSKEDVSTIKEKISKHYTITDFGTLHKHLSVAYEWKSDGMGEYIAISMEEFTKGMIVDFKEEFDRLPKEYATPAFPGTTLTKCGPEEEVFRHEAYRTLVGKLLWLVKKHTVDCCNITRELSRHMQGPTQAHWKAAERVLGYLIKNGNKELKLRKPKELRIEAFVDSDFATNKETRKSVSGNLVTIGGTLVSWRSKSQVTVALSSTEAEYVALSTVATEVQYVRMMLEEIIGTVPRSTIHEDNTGAIFMVKNSQIGERTKHIDTRHHYVKQQVENGTVEVVYINTLENPADIMTKNVKEVLHKKFSPRIFEGILCTTTNKEDVVEHVPAMLGVGCALALALAVHERQAI